MLTITKCKGTNCPIKTRCYRHTALISCVGELCENNVVKDYVYDEKEKHCVEFVQNVSSLNTDCV